MRVNAIGAGPVATVMLDRFTGGTPGAMAARVPLGRVAAPEEIAQTALWLASSAAGFVTGAVVPVDGGLTA